MNGGRKRAGTKRLKEKFSTREVVCIPFKKFTVQVKNMTDELFVKVPRCRNKFNSMGLVEIIDISNMWNTTEMNMAILDTFKNCFKKFSSFEYLKYKPGLKLLAKPKVVDDFRWDGKSVLSLSPKKIYIYTEDALAFSTVEVTFNELVSFKSYTCIYFFIYVHI